jgi:hypothetical protein
MTVLHSPDFQGWFTPPCLFSVLRSTVVFTWFAKRINAWGNQESKTRIRIEEILEERRVRAASSSQGDFDLIVCW